jgi:hypothetical protein
MIMIGAARLSIPLGAFVSRLPCESVPCWTIGDFMDTAVSFGYRGQNFGLRKEPFVKD